MLKNIAVPIFWWSLMRIFCAGTIRFFHGSWSFRSKFVGIILKTERARHRCTIEHGDNCWKAKITCLNLIKGIQHVGIPGEFIDQFSRVKRKRKYRTRRSAQSRPRSQSNFMDIFLVIQIHIWVGLHTAVPCIIFSTLLQVVFVCLSVYMCTRWFGHLENTLHSKFISLYFKRPLRKYLEDMRILWVV